MKLYRKSLNTMLSVMISTSLCLLLNLNSIRCMLNISDSSMIINLLYVLFVALCLPRFLKCKGPDDFFSARITAYILSSISLVLLCVVTGVIANEYASMLKWISIVLTGFCILKVNETEIRRTLDISLIVSSVYVVYVIFNINAVNHYISKGSNYLNVTLPIGFMMTVLLIRGIMGIVSKNNKKLTAIYFVLALTHMYSLTLFSSRGSILIPVAIVLLIGMIIGLKDLKTFVTVIMVLLAIGITGYVVFTRYAGSYLMSRMYSLFESNKSEDRWKIWKDYIELIKLKSLWIIGGGTNYSKRYFGMYPHNFYLQMIGEFGIVGSIYSIIFTFVVYKSMISKYRSFRSNYLGSNDSVSVYFQVLAALLYTFFTFMKSFSIYDSSLLIICCSMGIAISSTKRFNSQIFDRYNIINKLKELQ